MSKSRMSGGNSGKDLSCTEVLRGAPGLNYEGTAVDPDKGVMAKLRTDTVSANTVSDFCSTRQSNGADNRETVRCIYF